MKDNPIAVEALQKAGLFMETNANGNLNRVTANPFDGIADGDLANLGGLPELLNLGLTVPPPSINRVSDVGMAHLVNVTSVQELYVGYSKITGDGLEYLKNMQSLTVLAINDTHVADSGLAHLAGLSNLEIVNLSSTLVSDAGLAHLAGLKRLRKLHLDGTRVTTAGVIKLRQALPGCDITR